jgi:hypothetical protein
MTLAEWLGDTKRIKYEFSAIVDGLQASVLERRAVHRYTLSDGTVQFGNLAIDGGLEVARTGPLVAEDSAPWAEVWLGNARLMIWKKGERDGQE